MEQLTIFQILAKPQPIQFDGETLSQKRDSKRLNAQYAAVFALMRDGQFRTLAEISQFIGAPETSVSARLRDCRKQGHRLDRQHVKNGLHQYRLTIALPSA